MEITFISKKYGLVFNSSSSLIQKYGKDRADKIMKLLSFMKAAQNLEQVPVFPPYRRHQLKGNRKGMFAVDINRNYRLIFVPNHEPLPLLSGGGTDLRNVTAITILDVEDYHND